MLIKNILGFVSVQMLKKRLMVCFASQIEESCSVALPSTLFIPDFLWCVGVCGCVGVSMSMHMCVLYPLESSLDKTNHESLLCHLLLVSSKTV